MITNIHCVQCLRSKILALSSKKKENVNQKRGKINRKFRVPRKQGAHFLGERDQIQDSWVFSSSV
jgi:hypothetical protein